MPSRSTRPSPAEVAILRTVLYASLFEFPLTLWEVKRTLLESTQSESEILRTYQSSPYLQKSVEYRDGWFFPRGHGGWIRERRRREIRSLNLLNRHRWLLTLICCVPFVRLVALSGSLAALNAEKGADLDLFVITRGPRAWTATLAVVLLAKLARRRRIVCLNFVMTDGQLGLEQQDVFSANQMIQLRPLCGDNLYREFLAANPFVRAFYPNFEPDDRSPFPIAVGPIAAGVKRAVETVFDVPSCWMEPIIRRAYGWHLRRRATDWRSPDQVRLLPGCLKLHTHSHRAAVIERFERACADAFAGTAGEMIPASAHLDEPEHGEAPAALRRLGS